MKNINAQTLNTTTEITEDKAMTIVNLTQHNATNDQIDAGVFNVDYDHNELDYLRSLLTFDSIPAIEDMQQRADEIAKIALRTNAKKAMIGGAPFFMGYLETALKSVGIQPLYAFSQRVSVETTAEDGTVTKQNVFKHMGFVEV